MRMLVLLMASPDPSVTAYAPRAATCPPACEFEPKQNAVWNVSPMNCVRNKLPQYIAALLPTKIYEQVWLVLFHCRHTHPRHPIRLPPPSGSQLLRLPVASIITPSLATRIIEITPQGVSDYHGTYEEYLRDQITMP